MKAPWRFIVLVALLVVRASALAAEPLVPLTQPGPWSAISSLIGYGDRLWFVNSVKFVDHNSADIYSYDPATGRARYERHLFSQDAGDPVVAHGLLYWPFEDPRFSVGHGEYAVTNGREWQWRAMPASDVFHVHAMIADRGALYAATSAWRASLQRSDDGGATWRVIYDHPTPRGEVTRMTTLAALDGILYAGLTSSGDGVKLLRWSGARRSPEGGVSPPQSTMQPVPGWPHGRRVIALRTFRGWLYGVNHDAAGSSVWRTDGTRVERVTGLDREPVHAIAASGDALWAVSARHGAGTLWRSGDGATWTSVQRFARAEPVDVASHGGHAYVGTIGPGDGGTLWGPPSPAAAEPSIAAPLLPPRPHVTATRAEIDEAVANLDRRLAEPTSYDAHGVRLREAIEPLALSRDRDAGTALANRLDGPFPERSVRLFGDSLHVPAATLARWHLLRGIAMNGHGRVARRWLEAPWTATPNRAEKYLEPAPAAAWAVGELGQADDDTIATLVRRLGAPDHPRWMDGDLVGALTVLTGERFGYDVASWRRWCKDRACARP